MYHFFNNSRFFVNEKQQQNEEYKTKTVENTYCKFKIQYEDNTGYYGHNLPPPLLYSPKS